jgi:hypothetical protein
MAHERLTMRYAMLFLFPAVLFCAVPAVAMPGGAAGSFDRADADKDGILIWEEFRTAFPSLRREAFDLIDADRDGRISREEWTVFRIGHDTQSGPGRRNATAPGMRPPAGAVSEPAASGAARSLPSLPFSPAGSALPLLAPPAQAAPTPALPLLAPPAPVQAQ